MVRLRELLFLASLERARRLEVAEADVVAPNDPDAVYRLHPADDVRTQRQLRATSSKAMMALRMEADANRSSRIWCWWAAATRTSMC